MSLCSFDSIFCIDDAEFCWRLPQQLLWSSNTVSLITPISVRTHKHTHTNVLMPNTQTDNTHKRHKTRGTKKKSQKNNTKLSFSICLGPCACYHPTSKTICTELIIVYQSKHKRIKKTINTNVKQIFSTGICIFHLTECSQ